MDAATVNSVSLLVLVGSGALLLVHRVMSHLNSNILATVFVVLLAVCAFAFVCFIDTNVPLQQSHFRPSGGPAPVWLALLAWASRVGFLVAFVLAFQRKRSNSRRAATKETPST
jgi:Trk-type K+ transport system membrane component